MVRSVPTIAAVAAVLLALAGDALPTAAASATIRGTIRMNGCAIAPSDLVVRTSAVGAGGHGRRDVAAPAGGERAGHLGATSDPHVLTFSVAGLRPGSLHHLGITHKAARRGGAGPCGRVFWSGPRDGLVVAGGRAVAITGYAARTQLEVRRPSGAWVGADSVPLADPDGAARVLRWRTGIPSAVSGELQLALAPFPIAPQGNSCAEPRGGIVARVPLAVARGGRWARTEAIDLAALLAPRRTARRDAGSPRARHLPRGAVVDGLTAAQQAAVAGGAPIWLRVVPQRVNGPACATRTFGVHGWAILADLLGKTGDPDDASESPALHLGTGHAYDAPFFDPKGHPSGDESAYLVVKTHQLPTLAQAMSLAGMAKDPLGSALVRLGVWKGKTVLHPGAWFWIDPGDGSWWDDLTDSVGDLVTGAIDAIGFLVDSVSKAYAEIKQVAAKIALTVLQNVPLVSDACAAAPDVCRKAIEMGIDAALSSVGMPPSLPNWDQLKGQALDYAAAQLESQTGIPAEVTKEAYQQLAQEAMDRASASRGGKGVQYDWVAPYYGYDPAIETLVLTATGDLPATLLLEREESSVFLGDLLALPRALSGTVAVPMVLQGDTSAVGAPVCKAFGAVVPCGDAFTARWYRNAFRKLIKTTACTNLKTFSKTWTWPLAILPAPADLAVSSFSMVRPTVDATWNGTFANDC